MVVLKRWMSVTPVRGGDLKTQRTNNPGAGGEGAERLGFGPGVQDLPHGGGDFTPSEGLLFFVLLCELMPRKKNAVPDKNCRHRGEAAEEAYFFL